MRPLIWTLIAALLMLPIAEAQASEAVRTVADVSDHIVALHGKTVRLQGQMDECMSLVCSICTDDGASATCLGISLQADSPAARAMVEELYRFATITVDARVDATCSANYDPSKGRIPGEVVVCTDRATTLMDARVVAVDFRRSATEGRFDDYSGSPMAVVAAEESAPVIAAWRSQQAPGPHAASAQVKLFSQVRDTPAEATSGYVVVVCREDSCDGRWPKTFGQCIRSPGNPYECVRAKPLATEWVFSR